MRTLFFFAQICHNRAQREAGIVNADGQRQEAEQRYITGSENLKELAAALHIPLTSLKRWCTAGGWVKKREKFQARAMRKAVTKAADKKARELAKLLQASETMENALIMAAEALLEGLKSKPNKLTDGQFRAGNVEHIAKALNKQAETRMLISGVMAAADREKIALLKRKQELEERKEKEDRENGGMVIRLEEAVDNGGGQVIE